MYSARPLYYNMIVTAIIYIAINGSRLAFPLYALELGAAPFAVGLISAVVWVFPLLVSWPVGALSDRHGARWLLVAGAACGIVSMVIPYAIPGLMALFVAAALSGLWNAVYHVITLSLMGMLSEPARLSRSFVWYSMIGSGVNFLGPLLTGFAIEHLGYRAAFLSLSAAPMLVVVILLIWGRILPRGKPRAAARVNVGSMLSDRSLLRLLAIGGCVQVGVDLFPFFMPLYGHSIGLTPSAIGGVVGAIYVSSFAMQLVTPHSVSRFGEERVLSIGLVAAAASFLLVPVTSGAIALGAAACLFGFSLGSGQPISTALLFNHSGKSGPGTALGLRLTVNNVIRVMGPVVMGALGSALGLMPMFWVTAALLGAGSALSRPGAATQRHGSHGEGE